MKLEIVNKTRMRERGARGGAIVTRYGCAILRDNEAQSESSERAVDVQLTFTGDALGTKDVGDTIEIV
jgi:glutamate synthase domain-containing protein 1